MKRLITLTALLFVVAACGDSGDESDAPPADIPPETTSAGGGDDGGAIAAGGLALTAVEFGEGGFVEVTNTGDAPVSTAGHWLCQRPSYFELPEVELGPGESIRIAAGDEADQGDAVQVAAAGGSLGSFTADDGEMGLYSSRDFGSPSAIVSYVEWGSSGHGRSGTAVDAGIWSDGGFVDPAGASRILSDGAVDPSGWRAG